MNREIKAYSVSKQPMPTRKSAAIMGHFEPNISSPIVYLQKPKWISDQSFEEIIKCIRCEFEHGFNINQTPKSHE